MVQAYLYQEFLPSKLQTGNPWGGKAVVNRKASSQPKPPAALLKLTSSKVKHVASELGFSLLLFYTHAHRQRWGVGEGGHLEHRIKCSLKSKGAE